MISKTATVYLLKEAGWFDDVVYNVNDIIGNNDIIDKAKHYGSKVIDAGSNALKSGGKMLSDAAGRVSDTVGQAANAGIAQAKQFANNVGQVANTGIAHAKRFANDVGRGYSDLYKYVTKDPQFMQSIRQMSADEISKVKQLGAQLNARAHEAAATKAMNQAKFLEPFANAYNTVANKVKGGVQAAGNAVDTAVTGLAKRIDPETGALLQKLQNMRANRKQMEDQFRNYVGNDPNKALEILDPKFMRKYVNQYLAD